MAFTFKGSFIPNKEPARAELEAKKSGIIKSIESFVGKEFKGKFEVTEFINDIPPSGRKKVL